VVIHLPLNMSLQLSVVLASSSDGIGNLFVLVHQDPRVKDGPCIKLGLGMCCSLENDLNMNLVLVKLTNGQVTMDNSPPE